MCGVCVGVWGEGLGGWCVCVGGGGGMWVYDYLCGGGTLRT